MTYVKEISFYMNDRSEESNKQLAKKIVNGNLIEAVEEIADHLNDKNKTIASDCIAVLYHIGYEKPEMIAHLTDVFYHLLAHKNNRMVWGAMIALATISEIKPAEVETLNGEIMRVYNKGSLISQIWAYKTIATISKHNAFYDKYINFLLEELQKTRPIDFAKRAVIVNDIVRKKDKDTFLMILSNVSGLSKSASKTIEKLIKQS